MTRPFAILAPSALSADGKLLAFSYANSQAAAKYWTPQFGSKAARVEKSG